MMESAEEEKKMIEEPLLGTQKGGFRTMPFIIVNLAFERMASYGLGANMIVYLMTEYHLDLTTGSNILFFWSAATNFTPIIGAFIADSTMADFLLSCSGPSPLSWA